MIACLLGAAVPFALASGGSGVWTTPPAQISTSTTSGEYADLPAVALSSGGHMAAAWLDETGSQTNLNTSVNDDGGFSIAQNLGAADPWSASPGSQDQPQVAEDGSGNAVVVWIDGGDLMASYNSGGTTAFNAPVMVDGSGFDTEPHVVMDPAGNALAVWAADNTEAGWSVEYAVLPAGSTTWSSASTLASDLPDDPQPDVADNQSTSTLYFGGAAIVYVDQGVGIYSSSVGVIGDTFPAATQVYTSTAPLAQPVVAVSEDGIVDVAWVNTSIGGGQVWETFDSGGFIAPADWISSDADQSDPAIATNQTVQNDDTAAVSFYDGSDDKVVAAIQSSVQVVDADGWTGITPSSYAADGPQQPEISVSSNDAASMLWQAPGTSTGTQVDAITSSAGSPSAAGSFSGSPHAIVDGATIPACDGAVCSVLAADPAGDQVAVWRQDDSSSDPQVNASCYEEDSTSTTASTTTTGTITNTVTTVSTTPGTLNPSGCVSQAASTPPSTPPSTTTTTTTSTTSTTPPSTTTTSTTPPSTTATTTSTQSTTQTTPAPVVSQSSDLSRTSGTILVKLPGSKNFVRVSSSAQVPLGTVIDATHGTVTLTFALPDGQTTTAKFWGGDFTVSQAPSGAVTVKLTGSSFSGCPKPPSKGHSSSHALAHAAKAKTKTKSTAVRSLWSNAHGSYTTKGNYGSAAVLGTTWLTRDQCDGTYFKVTHTTGDPHGEIRVTVYYPHHHTILLKQGHSLLAPAPGYP